MTSQEFLELLWTDKPSDLYLLIWTLQDKRSRWFRNIEESAAAVAQTPQDVYVGVGLSPRDYGPSRRCPSEEIAGLAGLWADFDLNSDAHKRALPATIPDALSIIPAEIPPTIVVATGNGAHAWWLFKEPWIFDDAAERESAARLIARWHTLLRLNAAARGWAFDRLSDLARVLRIPCTVNGKDPGNPKPVTLFSRTDRRYNPSDFDDWMEDIPDPAAEQQTASDWAERFKDTPLVVNLNARIPHEMLERWIEADLRFRNTWFRQRHDLNDQSQSGYDLALADFGVDAGLSEQQIVDLIIHHRELHRQKQRTRIDYFQRTIAKAAKRTEGIDPVDILRGAAAPEPPPTPPQHASQRDEPVKQPDPVTTKGLLCERISRVLGIRILRLLKVTGKEPTYQMQLETTTIEFPHIGRFIDQTSVRLAIASATDRLIPKIKPKVWEQLAQSMLDALTEVAGGDETDFKGSIRMYIDQYLSDTGFIDTIENQPANALRCPTIIDGRIAICSSDLQLYVNRNFGQNLSVKAIASMLAAIGARNIQVRGKTFKPQSRWILGEEFSEGGKWEAGK